ncbi:hypothetical protein [Roseovarius sp. THAF9]|uniref:hypothetical protein n=1 Tax=Roseovarius sp. THAF9 TaxID=2587847 RepID=UPI0034A26E4C
MLQIFAELFKPVEVINATLVYYAIADVRQGGHFFVTQYRPSMRGYRPTGPTSRTPAAGVR